MPRPVVCINTFSLSNKKSITRTETCYIKQKSSEFPPLKKKFLRGRTFKIALRHFSVQFREGRKKRAKANKVVRFFAS
jgi:hypothetical protein